MMQVKMKLLKRLLKLIWLEIWLI